MADLMFQGYTAVDAYREAGYTGDPLQCANKITQNSAFQEYLDSLRVESTTSTILSVQERKEILSDMARGKSGDESHLDRRGAIAELNKMGGDYAPQKVEATVETTLRDLLPNLPANNGLPS